MNLNELKSVVDEYKVSAANEKSISVDIPMGLFNGSCLKKENNDEIFLVMDGKKSWIPNMETFKNLFDNTENVLCASGYLGLLLDLIIDKMENANDITNGAQLIKSDASDAVFLLTDNKKFGITSAEQFNTCHFSWSKIKTYPQIIVDAIPNGGNNSFYTTTE